MNTGTALLSLLLPIIYYYLKSQYYWRLTLEDIFAQWMSVKIAALCLLLTYSVFILYFGYEGVVGRGDSLFSRDWIWHFLLPGYAFAAVILPQAVANHWLGSGSFSEELAFVYGLLMLVLSLFVVLVF